MKSKEIIEWVMLGCSDKQKKYFEQVLKDLEQKEKQSKILDILKERAYLYVNEVNKDVKSIQINITTCDDNFGEVEVWLNGGK